MKTRAHPATLVVPPPPDAVSGLAALAFGSASVGLGAGKHLAFLPLDSLELDLDDPEQRDFGDYELVEQLGQGGMGVVYRAQQKSLQREVAVKLLSAGPWASPEFIARFTREAQSAARLQHPNIVSIFEIGTHEEMNFFSMQLVRGQSLAQRLDAQGPLPPREAARLLRTIAEALDYAHRLGILHLDLKPANVLIDEHGEPQVADFGLAKRLDESLASDSDEVSGTPSYMAPEQATARSQRIGVATDIYGLGAILYELLSGRPPFLGATPRQTLEQVVAAQPAALRDGTRAIPADLEAICLKCLAKEPAERYVTARGLAEDLGRFLEGRPVSVRPLNAGQRLQAWARREPRVAFAAATALVALVAGLIASSVQWRRAEANAAAALANLWSARGQTAQAAMAQGDAFRGLGALVQNLGEMEDAGRQDYAATERQRIGTALANAPQPIDVLRLPQGLSVSALALSPDGRRLAVASYGNRVPRTIREFDLDTGAQRWETVTDGLSRGMPVAGTSPHGRLAYTPDGKHVLAHVMQNTPFPAPAMSDGILLEAERGQVVAPVALPADHADFVFSDDGRFALQRSRAQAAMRFPQDGQLFRVEDWQPLGPRVAHGVENGFEWLFAPDGSSLLGSGDFIALTLFEPATLTPRWRLQLPDQAPARAWRFSPDGRWLALGTTQGRVFLADTRQGRYEELPSAPSATVRWLEFDREGRTLAARAEDGTLAAWDVATRRPRMAAYRLPDLADVQRLRLVGDTVLAAGGNGLHLLDLAPASPFNREPVAHAAQLRNRRHVMSSAFDYLPARRLLAMGGSDGLITLWRMPRPPLLAVAAAPLPQEQLHFDGRHVLAVDGPDAQLVDVDSGDARGPLLHHPQPVRVAERTPDGGTLYTIAGRTLRVFDAARGTLRGEPVVLPQTPLRVLLAPGAGILLLTTLDYVGETPVERLHRIDLQRARVLGQDGHMPAFPEGLAFDPQGRYLLYNRLGDAATLPAIVIHRFDATDPSCAELTLDPQHNPRHSALAAEGGTAWSYVSTADRRGVLLRWDTQTCQVRLRLPMQQGSGNNYPRAWGEGVAVNQLTVDHLTLFGPDGTRREVPGMTGWRPMLEFALSGDGRRAALAGRNAVQLFDLERGERLSAPLAAPIAGEDAIAKLAFSPDGQRLLARTVGRRWLRWDLPGTDEPVPDLAALAPVLDPNNAQPELDEAAFAALRARLRARAVPAPATATGSVPAAAPPAIELAPHPGEGVDPRFLPLDLTPVINARIDAGWPPAQETPGDAPTLALGPQRLNAVDWRVDGAVQLNGGGPATHFGPALPITPELPLPAGDWRRVHALVRINVPIARNAPPKVAAQVRLVGTDGREHALDILTRKHLVTSGWDLESLLEPGARIAWGGIGAGMVREGWSTSSDAHAGLFAVALDVPPGTGPLRGLRLAIGDGPIEAPLVYAVTLERAAPAAPPREESVP